MQFVRKMVVMGAILASLGIGLPALAQTADQTPQATSSSPAPVPDQGTLKPAELEGLVAPIALYPDTLLSNVLMASTYPLEVVHAARWLNQNKDLKGDVQKTGAEKQEWDASVKALIATPSVLQMMNEHLEWTQKLGEAFLAQQQDVMDAVQRLRSKAYDRKKLVTTNEQKVTVREDQNRQFIYIEPAAPDSIYVPYYEPQVVFGDWPYSDYPAYPYYWGYPGYIGAGLIATGVAFSTAYALGRWATRGYWGSGGWWGGSRVNWGGGAIDINRGAHVEHWRHDTRHRQGARYNNSNLQQRFGNANRPQGGRQGLGNAANRPNAGNRAQRGERSQRADRSRPANRQAGANRNAGNRQARNPSTAGRHGRSRNRVAHRGGSRAGHFRPAAGRGGPARFAGGGHRPAAFRGAGGGRSFHGGGGGFRGGGGRGGGGRGGGRRSDINLKHDVVLLGRLDNGIGYYRFAYNGSDKAYVGVIAQEVQEVRPDAVTRGNDGYLRVHYERLGLPFRSYESWARSGGVIPRSSDGSPPGGRSHP